MTEKQAHFYGTVKVGERGQVVIPADARKDLNIKQGDLLLVMSGKDQKGIAMVKADVMREFAQKLIHGLEPAQEKEP